MLDVHYIDAHYDSNVARIRRQLTRLAELTPVLDTIRRHCPNRLNTEAYAHAVNQARLLKNQANAGATYAAWTRPQPRHLA